VGGRGSWQMGCYTKKKWFRAVNQLHIQSSLKPKHGLNDPQILTHVYTCHIHIQEGIAPPHYRRRDATAAAVMMAMFDVDQPAQPRPQQTDFRRRLRLPPTTHHPHIRPAASLAAVRGRCIIPVWWTLHSANAGQAAGTSMISAVDMFKW
jgi:hypothetical protein